MSGACAPCSRSALGHKIVSSCQPTGCARVCLLDQEPLALQCAVLAASLNGLQVIAPEAMGPATSSSGPRIDGPSSACPGAPALELLPFDWTLDDPRPLAADIVVASDVLYEARFVEVRRWGAA